MFAGGCAWSQVSAAQPGPVFNWWAVLQPSGCTEPTWLNPNSLACFITTIKQVGSAPEETNVSSRAQVSAWNTVEEKHWTQNYWGDRISLHATNNPVVAPHRASVPIGVNLATLFNCCCDLELRLLKKQREQVREKEGKGSKIVFGA